MQSQHKTFMALVLICLCCISLRRMLLIVMDVNHRRKNDAAKFLPQPSTQLQNGQIKRVEEAPTPVKLPNITVTNSNRPMEQKVHSENITDGSFNMKSLVKPTTEKQYKIWKKWFYIFLIFY